MDQPRYSGFPAVSPESPALPPTFLSILVLGELLVILLAFWLPDPVLPLGLVLTAFFGLLIMLDLRMSIVAIAFVTFFIHSEIIGEIYIVQLAGINLYAMDWILIFSACSLLYHRAAGRGGLPAGGRLGIPVGLFILMLPLFVFVGIGHGLPTHDASADARLFFYYISYFLAAAVIRDESDLSLAFWCVLLMGIAGAVPEIVSSLSHPEIDRQTGRLLAFGRIRGANEVNYPMLLAAAVAAFPYMNSFPKKLAVGTGAIISAVALFLSYTRGSWLAAGAGIIGSMIIYRTGGNRRLRAIRILAGGALLVVVIFGVLDVLGVFTLDDLVERLALTSLTQIDISTLQRLTEWVDAWGVFLDNPVLGAGLGYTYTFFALGVGNITQTWLHNSYLYVLSKMGIVGLSLFLLVFWRALVVSRRTAAELAVGPTSGYFLAFCTMLVVLLVKSFTTWHLNTLTTSLFVGMILGIVAGRLKAGRAVE